MTEKRPGIIDPPTQAGSIGNNRTLHQWMSQITEAVRQGLGQIGDSANSYVTFNDLVNNGVLRKTATDNDYHLHTGEVGGGYYEPIGFGEGQLDLTPPDKPKNVEITNGFTFIFITFDWQQRTYPLHAEIWRSSTTDRNKSVLIGTAEAGQYADQVGLTDTTYYYWVRMVKTVSNRIVYGSFHDGYPLVGQAQGRIDGENIAENSIPSAAIGSLAVDKLVGDKAAFISANITNGSITNAKIGNEIYSDNYYSAFSNEGWRLSKNGDAVFRNIYARGDIEATSIKAGTANIISSLMLENNAVLIPKFDFNTQKYKPIGPTWQTIGSIVLDRVSGPTLVLASTVATLRNYHDAGHPGGHGGDVDVGMRFILNGQNVSELPSQAGSGQTDDEDWYRTWEGTLLHMAKIETSVVGGGTLQVQVKGNSELYTDDNRTFHNGFYGCQILALGIKK